MNQINGRIMKGLEILLVEKDDWKNEVQLKGVKYYQ